MLTATDDAGNATTVMRTVTYQPATTELNPEP